MCLRLAFPVQVKVLSVEWFFSRHIIMGAHQKSSDEWETLLLRQRRKGGPASIVARAGR